MGGLTIAIIIYWVLLLIVWFLIPLVIGSSDRNADGTAAVTGAQASILGFSIILMIPLMMMLPIMVPGTLIYGIYSLVSSNKNEYDMSHDMSYNQYMDQEYSA